MPKGRPATKTPQLAAQILTLFPPPSVVTVATIMAATGESHKTVSRALYHLDHLGKACRDGVEKTSTNRYSNTWKIKP